MKRELQVRFCEWLVELDSVKIENRRPTPKCLASVGTGGFPISRRLVFRACSYSYYSYCSKRYVAFTKASSTTALRLSHLAMPSDKPHGAALA
jgi:hypothetical protein